MADRALILHSEPPLCIYSGARPGGYDLAWPRLAGFPSVRRELRISGGANGSATVSVDNGDGTLTTELLHAPLRVACTLTEDGDTLLTGLLTRVRSGPTLQLDIEAGSPRRYTDPVPLRTSAAWGEYLQIETLPQVYGAVTLNPLAYDGSGEFWLLADHPIAGVDAVEINGEPTNAWMIEHHTDSAGHAVAVLVTLDQVENAADISVTLRGKPHPVSGVLMDRPDLVLWDLLANVCGMDYAEADFDSLRSASQSDGLTVGGVVDDDTVSIQTWVDRICQGAGLAWSPQAEGVAILWPAAPDAPVEPDRTLTTVTAPGLTAESDQEALTTVVELAYAHDYAGGGLRRTLRLKANAAIEQYGEIEKRISAAWIHSPAAALAYATRWLQYHSRPLWTVQAGRSAASLTPGECLSVAHPYSPATVVTATRIVRSGITDTITAQAPYGAVPDVELVSTGAGVSPGVLVGTSYDYRDGVITLLITGYDGEILSGTRCTLDGGTPRYTDERGFVQFEAAPGAHSLRVEPAGETPIVYELIL
jgi:hypothetical protein